MQSDMIMDTARPRATPVRSPTQMSRSASSRSVRAGASKPAGYDNPLFTSGDVLGDREPDAADVMPLVVGDHAVLTPRRPESPLVAKLKAQASEKGYKLRQDRILNASVGVSPSFASGNPFFPATSPLRSPSTPTDSPAFHKRTAARKPPRLAQATDPDSPRPVRDDDTDSLDSLVLDDGPNPVKVVTPGTSSGCLRAFAPGSDAAADSSAAAGQPLATNGADTQQAPDEEEKRPASGSSEGQEGVPGQVTPHDTMPTIGAANPSVQGGDAARPCTPQRDRDLLNLLNSAPRSFIGTPGPILDPLKCYIVREKAPRGLMSKAPHVYKLYLEEGKVFLLAARRREHTKCPSYIITQDEASTSRSSNTYCGKIRSNFIGTEFQIFDDGERATKQTAATTMLRQASFFAGKRHFLSGSNNGGASAALDGPEKSPLYASLRRAGATAESAGGGASSMLEDTSEGDLGKGDGGAGCRGELGVVQYHMNVMGTKGPRKMVIGVPYVDLDTNHATKWNNGETMMNQLKRGSDSDMIRLVNKVPKWNTTLGAYCLNFNGRVTLASVKNFQLVAEHDEQEREVLQFGRIADHRFTMDYAWPLTAYQAFCICITSLDSKLACE